MWWRDGRRAGTGKDRSFFGRRNRVRPPGTAIVEQFEPRLLLSAAAPTNIPNTVFNITSYGAFTGSLNNVAAINAAITAASDNIVAGAQGGIVEIPTGTWMAGPTSAVPESITLASNVDLELEAGATLQAVPESSYLNEGTTSESSLSNFIVANNITNFEITGSGAIDGNGAAWWTAYANSGDTIARPRLIEIKNSSVFLIQGVTLQNSPFYNLSFGATNNVTVNGITISNPSTAPNTDGIDVAGSHYLIENSTISTGDDDIAIKPQDVFCSDITITNMTIGSGHGISVGGETNDGLNGLYVSNVTFNGTTNGIRLKADRGNGGVVENLYYSNISMSNVEYPILIDSYYNGSNDLPADPSADTGQTYVAGETPLWENIYFSNITSTSFGSNDVAGVIYGLPEAPVTNVYFFNVQLEAPTTGLQINHASNVHIDSSSFITFSGTPVTADVYGTTSTFPDPYDATLTPALYTNATIGSPTVPTGTSESLYDPDSQQLTLMGLGGGITGDSDQFDYLYGSVTGNYTVQAQLESISAITGVNSVAGVMYRNSTSPTDAFAAVFQTTADQIVFEYRTVAGANAVLSAPVTAPIGSYYVRVVRSGTDTFTGYYSVDGFDWTQIGSSRTISAIGNTALAGMAATSASNGDVNAAVFANFSSIPGPMIVQPANAIGNPIITTSPTTLSAQAVDNSGADGLVYTWSYTGPTGVTYFLNPNGSNAAQSIVANFTQAGTYDFTVTVSDPLGRSTSSSVVVTVNPPVIVLATPGYVDVANMNVISGWAYDPTDPTSSINVEVVISGGPTQTISADQTRSDLQPVIGSTNHGFTYTTPMLSTGDHTAYIYAVQTNGSMVLLNTEPLVSQNSLFDEHYYLKTYPNVAAAVAKGEFASGYDHYIEYGQYEGYSPSPYWDEAWYLKENPDVAAAVKAGTISSGFMHYYLYGQYEGRGGLLYFNTSYYLQNNPDVAAAISAGTITSAYEHFVLWGQYEGRSPMLYFNSAVYDNDNQDILPYVTGETFTSDFEQFIEYGQYEHRIASNYYNEEIYLSLNPDVAAAVAAGQYPDGFQQWLEYGQYEGRRAV
jgi:polygalacturonase